MKPIVLLAPAPAVEDVFHHDAWVLNKKYFMGVSAGGGVPLMPTEISLVNDYVKMADGLVLTGSAMYVPSPDFAERIKPLEKQGRDVLDAALFQAFRAAGKPVLGICRGHQVINLQMGGTLDKKFDKTVGIEHAMHKHEVTAKPGSLLFSLFGERFMTNSRHGNRAGVLGEGLIVTATACDGVVEALEHETLPIYAVQFHPERMRGDLPDPSDGPDTTPLFKRFCEICLEYKQKEHSYDNLPDPENYSYIPY